MCKELLVRGVRIDGELPKGSYLQHVSAIKNLKKIDELRFHQPVTFFVGENGIGKSTLIEAIAVAMGFNEEGGSANLQFSTEQTHSDLYNFITVSKGTRRRKDGFFLRAESFYNVASQLDEMNEQDSRTLQSYGGTSLHKQSHGESFMALVANRFGGQGLYILDEPEAALSPMRIMELMCHIDRLVKDDSQFLISTHSPILMAYPRGEVLQLTEQGITAIPYEETEHFRLTRQFLNAPEKMCQCLFGK